MWIPGTPPGHQPGPKSRSCTSIASAAPAGSWIVYRPTDNKKLVHVREVDAHRTGSIVRIRIFDIDFSDNHGTGIYSFEYLRELCPCEACATKETKKP